MNIKKGCFLLLLFLFFNCTVQFDRNVRIESTGKVVDENNSPIADISVGVFTVAERTQGFYPSFNSGRTYELGNALTNSDGNFSITSLFDSSLDFSIFIDGEDRYTDYIYSANTSQFEPENFLFNLNEVQLKKRALVNINITRSSQPGTTLEFYINYESPFCEAVFLNGALDEESSNCFRLESIFRTLDDENPEYMRTINSFYTGTIQFGYSINGGSQTIETYLINQDNYDINFNY